jgi:hypothetical protein
MVAAMRQALSRNSLYVRVFASATSAGRSGNVSADFIKPVHSAQSLLIRVSPMVGLSFAHFALAVAPGLRDAIKNTAFGRSTSNMPQTDGVTVHGISRLGRCGPELGSESPNGKKPNHPPLGNPSTDRCSILWHSPQTVTKLVSASSPTALRRFT